MIMTYRDSRNHFSDYRSFFLKVFPSKFHLFNEFDSFAPIVMKMVRGQLKICFSTHSIHGSCSRPIKFSTHPLTNPPPSHFKKRGWRFRTYCLTLITVYVCTQHLKETHQPACRQSDGRNPFCFLSRTSRYSISV